MPLFFAGHGDGALGTNEGADTAAFAEIVVDLNVPGFLVSGDAEIRAEIAAQVAAAAKIIPKAPARLHHRCLLVKTRVDLIQVFSELILMPAPDFQFTRFSHPDYLPFTTESQRTQRKIVLCSIREIHSHNVSPLLQHVPQDGPPKGRASLRLIGISRSAGEKLSVPSVSLW